MRLLRRFEKILCDQYETPNYRIATLRFVFQLSFAILLVLSIYNILNAPKTTIEDIILFGASLFGFLFYAPNVLKSIDLEQGK